MRHRLHSSLGDSLYPVGESPSRTGGLVTFTPSGLSSDGLSDEETLTPPPPSPAPSLTVVPTETVVAELDEEISTMPPLDPLLQLDADLKQAVAPKAKPSKKDKLLTPKNVAMAALAGTMIYLLTRRS